MSLKIFSKHVVNYIKHFLLKKLEDVLFIQAVVLVLKTHFLTRYFERLVSSFRLYSYYMNPCPVNFGSKRERMES